MAETNRAPDEAATPQNDGAVAAGAGADSATVASFHEFPANEPAATGTDPAAAGPANSADISDNTVHGPAAVRVDDAVAVPAPPVAQPVLAPAEDGPPTPKLLSNRLVGTAWVLLAAGLFELIYVALVALLVLLLGGPAAVGPETGVIMSSPFGWLPVIFFFLFFELTVLLVNRAGRFTYVVASLIVGLLVYIVSVLLVSVIVRGGLGDSSTLAQTFLLPWSMLTGLVAREVMLWVGFAIGARGRRLRHRNSNLQEEYARQLAEREDAPEAD